MRHDPASGAIVIMLRSLKMYGMAQAVTELMEQGAPAFEAAVPTLSQLLKAELAEREVRSIAYHMKAARFPAYIRAAAPLTADQIASLRALLAARVGDRVALRIEQALSDMARAPGAFEMRGGDAAVSPAAAAVHPLISIPPQDLCSPDLNDLPRLQRYPGIPAVRLGIPGTLDADLAFLRLPSPEGAWLVDADLFPCLHRFPQGLLRLKVLAGVHGVPPRTLTVN